MYPTTRGVLILMLATPLFALATWSSGWQWIAGGYLVLALALFVLDWKLAGKSSRFFVIRQHALRLSLGAENPVVIQVKQKNRRPVDFWVRDESPPSFFGGNGILEGQLKPYGSWEATYYLRPLRRGDYRFGDLNIRWRSPLGLLIKQVRVKAAEPVKVYPNLMDVERYDLLLRKNRLQEMGLRHSRMFGEGTEFERLREYLPDDDYRRINWKATARRHRPVTIEYQTERSQNVIAVVDTGRMMQSPVNEIAKLDHVINAVLLLAFVATSKGDKVGLLTFADDVSQYINPRAGRGQFYRLLELLYRIEPQPVEPDYHQALSYLALKQRKRSLIVIFTDLSGDLGMKSLIQRTALLAQNNLPLVVTISDPDVHAMSRIRPSSSLEVYQRQAADTLLEERRIALDHLRRQGVLTLDVPANGLSMAVINRYLELKGRMLL